MPSPGCSYIGGFRAQGRGRVRNSRPRPLRKKLHRLEMSGNNDVHWVKVLVDPRSREVFTYEPQVVREIARRCRRRKAALTP